MSDKNLLLELKKLKLTAPRSEFKSSIENLISSLPYQNRSISYMQLLPRLALIILLLTLVSGTGFAIASQNSRPGDLLYSVKHVVSQIKTKIVTSPVQSTVPGVTQIQTATPRPTPTPNNENVKAVVNVHRTATDTSLLSTPAATSLPLPTTTSQPATLTSSPTTTVTVTTPLVGATLEHNKNTQPLPSSTSGPTYLNSPSSSPQVTLPTLHITSTQANVEVNVGKSDKPLLKIGL